MFNDPKSLEFIRGNKNNPALKWIIDEFEKEKKDVVKKLCVIHPESHAEKSLIAQGQLILIEQALNKLTDGLNAR